jgi:hypothetical protein
VAVDATTLLHHNDLVIGGECSVATGETFDTVSPTTNEPVGRMAKAGVEDVNAPSPQGVRRGTVAANDTAGAVARHAQDRFTAARSIA